MKWSIQQAARELRVSRETVRRRLARIDVHVEVTSKRQFTTKQIFDAMAPTPMEREQMMAAQRNRLIREKEDAEKAANLIPSEEVEFMYQAAVDELRKRLPSLPRRARAINPENPKETAAVLKRWANQTLAMIPDRICKS